MVVWGRVPQCEKGPRWVVAGGRVPQCKKGPRWVVVGGRVPQCEKGVGGSRGQGASVREGT